MHAICFHLGARPIYWYGVFMALGFTASLIHLRWLGRRAGRDPDFASDLLFWAILSGILGARIAYVFANLPQYLAHPQSIWRIDQGGLIFYGGFLGAGVALLIFAWQRKEKVSSLFDFIITALPLGHALGRVGCFMNGCCYGRPSRALTALVMPEVDLVPRHPVQLYETGCDLLVYLLLLRVFFKRTRDGQVLAAYLLAYPVVRFLLEFFRGDERVRWTHLAVAQWTSLALFALGVALWLRTRGSNDPASQQPR